MKVAHAHRHPTPAEAIHLSHGRCSPACPVAVEENAPNGIAATLRRIRIDFELERQAAVPLPVGRRGPSVIGLRDGPATRLAKPLRGRTTSIPRTAEPNVILGIAISPRLCLNRNKYMAVCQH